MNKVVKFVKESYDEIVNKVSWPKFAQLQSSAVLVLVASLIFALLIWVVDVAFENGMDALYQSF
jgi:preprotein translocase subunit SecE